MAGIQEDNLLRFSFRNHFTAFYSVLILMGFIAVWLLYTNFDEGMVIACTVGLSLDIVPTLYLHIEYLLKNNGEAYEVHFDELVRYKNGEKTTYKVSDIKLIKVYMSPALYRRSNFHLLGIEAYHYARVQLKSGEELIITCLLTPKVERVMNRLRGVKIERKKCLFNTLKWK